MDNQPPPPHYITSGPFKDYSSYQPAMGIVGAKVEAVGHLRNDQRSIFFFDNSTYLVCLVVCE